MPADRPGRARSWLRDERLLALDLYLREGPNAPVASTEALSQLLRSFPIESELANDPRFRSEPAVRRKLANFRALDPADESAGLDHTSGEDAAVWIQFHDDPDRLSAIVNRIVAAMSSHEIEGASAPELDFAEGEEGALLTRLHRVRERNRGLVERKKRQALNRHGALRCETCGFEFGLTYGEPGEGFIECHHRRPLSELRPGQRTKLSDLALLCANCHRVLHRRRSWLTVEQLAQILSAQRSRLE